MGRDGRNDLLSTLCQVLKWAVESSCLNPLSLGALTQAVHYVDCHVQRGQLVHEKQGSGL